MKPKLEIEIKSHFFPLRLKGISFLLKLQKFPLKQLKLKEKLEIVKWNFVKKKDFENPKVSLVLT